MMHGIVSTLLIVMNMDFDSILPLYKSRYGSTQTELSPLPLLELEEILGISKLVPTLKPAELATQSMEEWIQYEAWQNRERNLLFETLPIESETEVNIFQDTAFRLAGSKLSPRIDTADKYVLNIEWKKVGLRKNQDELIIRVPKDIHASVLPNIQSDTYTIVRPLSKLVKGEVIRFDEGDLCICIRFLSIDPMQIDLCIFRSVNYHDENRKV
jgi:hypothetical protein